MRSMGWLSGCGKSYTQKRHINTGLKGFLFKMAVTSAFAIVEWEDSYVSILKFITNQISITQQRFLCSTLPHLRDPYIGTPEGGSIS